MNLIELAHSKGRYLCSAESLTAGRVAIEIAKTPGASRVFLGSVVAYSDASKIALLDVPKTMISAETAVSESVANAMSQNSRARFAEANDIELAEVVSVATTGVAGPDPVGAKPAGLVFISISSSSGTLCHEFHFSGSREEISAAATQAALQLIREELEQI